MGDITGSKARKEAKRAAQEQQRILEEERAAKAAAAKELAQQQTEEFRTRQKRGVRSLVGTSEGSYLGE
jgi:hypothetical protein